MVADFSTVEKVFFEQSGVQKISTRIPYILVNSCQKLGLLSALRFIEYVAKNPEGVVCLPTGKTAGYFISSIYHLLGNWGKKDVEMILSQYDLGSQKKPDLRGLIFVQPGEFYPINSAQHNSLFNFVSNYYINGLALDGSKALLINSNEIKLAGGKNYSEIFPGYKIDLSLRYREAKTNLEKLQRQSIFAIDDWCLGYENKIREKGGIGFFLGGIGPDGCIGFNSRGSAHFSSTRLTETNFETQAMAAIDLGGIEISRNRHVITIGLETISFNPDCTAIVYSAGEASAGTVRDSLQCLPNTTLPATALQKLRNSRFYLTTGAAVKLDDSVESYYNDGPWNHSKTERAVIGLCKKINKFGSKLTLDDLRNDPYCRLIPNLGEDTVKSVQDSIYSKIKKGMETGSNQVIYHTGPHHDDIMLGIMPVATRQQRVSSNEMHFSILTSGFTAVTNSYLIEILTHTKKLLDSDKIEMVNYSDFFKDGYLLKWDKDVYHCLDSIAAANTEEKIRGVCHRIVRVFVDIWKLKDKDGLILKIDDILCSLKESYDGSINPPEIQELKGRVRELEEEMVWAHYGVRVKNVHHLKLGFYQDNGFNRKPNKQRDVIPLLEEFRKYNPTCISVVMDPQGSGPDTHYRSLLAIARAVEEWGREKDLSGLKIIGYRNVWYRFHPADVEAIVPVSLNSLALLDKSFSDCYLSQVNASFPSYELDGKFSTLTQKIWVEQLKQIQLLLGKNFFYENELPLLRATHGLIYIREMNVPQFLEEVYTLEKSTEDFI